MKTARFTELVKAAGNPEPFTLWTDPKKDRAFQAALRAHRVLSVHQETVGTKADYGTVGYDEDKHAQILIFPKSIQRFAGKKVVGVKYELLEDAGVAAPRPAPKPRKPSKPARGVAKAREPKLEVLKKALAAFREEGPKKPREEKPATPPEEPRDKSAAKSSAAKLEKPREEPSAKAREAKIAKPREERAREKPARKTGAKPQTGPREKTSPNPAEPKRGSDKKAPPKEPDRAELLAGIRKALKLLKAGKDVAAYQALEKLA